MDGMRYRGYYGLLAALFMSAVGLLSCVSAASDGEEFVVGEAPIPRANLDTVDRRVLLINADKPVPKNGHCTKFTFYVQKRVWPGSGILKMYRERFPNGTYDYYYFGRLTVDSTGVKTHTVPAWKRYINVRKGDLIGIENMWGEPAMIPYDGEECEGKNASTLFFSIPKTAYRYEVFKELPAGSKPCRKYSVQLHCKEGFAHGPRPMDRPKQDSATKEMYVMNSNLPWTGKLVSWELYSKRAGEIYLGVFRGTLNSSQSVGMRKQYKLVASKKYVLPGPGLHRFKLVSSEQLDVQKSDRLGFYFNHGNPIPYSTGLCYREGNGYPREGDAEMWYKAPRIIQVGKTYNMKLVKSDVEFPDCRHYSIQATIMPKED